MGGGGASSSSYPEYISHTQEAWLKGNIGNATEIDDLFDSVSMSRQLITALGNNPYTGNPSADLYGPSGVSILTPAMLSDANKNVTDALAYNAEDIFEASITKAMADISIGFGEPGADGESLKDTFNTLIDEAITKAGLVMTDTHDTVQPMIQDSFNTIRAALIAPMKGLVNSATTNSDNFPTVIWNENVSKMQTLIGDVLETVKNNADTVIDSAIAKALVIVNDASGQINSDVDAFETRTINRHQRSVGRFAGQMSNMNANMTSSFAIGIALLESDRGREVSEYEAGVKGKILDSVIATYPSIATGDNATLIGAYRDSLAQHIDVFKVRFTATVESIMNMIMNQVKQIAETQRDIITTAQDFAKQHEAGYMSSYSAIQAARNQYIFGMTQVLTQLKGAEFSQKQAAYGGRIEAQRMIYVINKEYNDTILEREVLRSDYPMQVYSHAGNLLASSSGAAVVSKGPSKGQSVMGGAAAGASLGATIGSVIPGVGTAIGGAVGAVAGGIGGASGG
jgi:hypothetical protein